MTLPAVSLRTDTLVKILQLYAHNSSRYFEIYSASLQALLDQYPLPAVNESSVAEMAERPIHNGNVLLFASLFPFTAERLRLSAAAIDHTFKCPATLTRVALAQVLGFLSVSEIAGIIDCFPALLDLIFRSAAFMPSIFFEFSLKATVVHFISKSNAPLGYDVTKRLFPTFSLDQYELFHYVLCHSARINDEKCTSYLMNLVIASRNIRDGDFDHFLLNCLSAKLESFDVLSLEFLAHLAKYRPNDTVISHFLIRFPAALSKFFDCKFPEVHELPLSEELLSQTNPSYRLEFTNVFPNGFSPVSIRVFDSEDEIDIPECPIFPLLRWFLNDLPVSYLPVFFEAFPTTDHDLFFVLVLFFREFPKFSISARFVDKLLKGFAFCPELTVFGGHENFPVVFSVRRMLFDLFLQEFPTDLLMLLSKISKFPLLFAEMIGRIHAKLSSFDPSLLTEEDCLSLIMQNLGVLKLRYKNSKYQAAMATVYIFLIAILDDLKVMDQCYSTESFPAGFLPCLYQPALREPVLLSLSKYMQSYLPSIQMLKVLAGIITCCESSSLIEDLIATINGAVDVNSAISKPIFQLVPYFTSFLERAATRECLSSVIHLYMRVSDGLYHRNLERITRIIRRIDANKVSEDTLSAFICMMTGTRTVSLGMMGLIHDHSIVLPFLSLFRDDQSVAPYLDFLEQLCRGSAFNCYQCHRAELDLLLLEMYQDHKRPYTFRAYEFDWSSENSITFLCYLATVISSPSVAMRYISLMEKDMRVLEVLHSQWVGCKKNVFAIGSSSPCIESEQFIDALNEFSMQFWIMSDDTLARCLNASVSLFSLHDSGSKVGFVLSGGSLIVRVTLNGETFSAMMATGLPPNKWAHVTITCGRGEDGDCNFAYSVDGSNYDVFSVAFPGWSKRTLNFSIGNLVHVNEGHDQTALKYPVFISDFRLLNVCLSKTDLMKFGRDYGRNLVYQIHKRSHCFYRNLLSVFALERVSRSLIPLFHFLDEFPDGFPELLLDFIKWIIEYSPEAKIDFELIAYFLSKQTITYSMYMRFFGILGVCSESPLIQGLVGHVFINIDLWIGCDQFHRIIQLWGSSLVNSCGRAILSVARYSLICAQICYYFCSVYDPPKTAQRRKDLDCDSCRQNLAKVMIGLSSIEFLKSDAVAVIAYAASARDPELADFFIDLLTHLPLPSEVAGLFFVMLRPNRENHFMTILQLIYRLTGETFSQSCDSIIFILNDYFCTKQLFKALLGSLKEFPLTFPILIYISFNFGEQEQLAVAREMKTINVSKLDRKQLGWLVFTLLLVIKLNGQDYDLVVFLATVILNDFSLALFDHIIRFSSFFGQHLGHCLEDYIWQVTKVVVDFYGGDDVDIRSQLFLRFFSVGMFHHQYDQREPRSLNFKTIPLLIKEPLADRALFLKYKPNEQMLKSAVRLYQALPQPSARVAAFGDYLTAIQQKETISQQLNARLEMFLPPFFRETAERHTREDSMNWEKLQDFWTVAQSNAIDCCASFTSQDTSIGISGQFLFREHLLINKAQGELKFKRLRKHEMNEFSIWNHRKLYFTEVRRSFRYSQNFGQIRLRKASGCSAVPFVGKGFKCELIRISGRSPTRLSVTEDYIMIGDRSFPIGHLRAVLIRNIYQRPTAIEFILRTGGSFLLDFSLEDRVRVLKLLKSSKIQYFQTSHPSEFVEKLRVTKSWIDGRTSNFEYLMQLNVFGGRSFFDSSLYPIFPWVLSDFSGMEPIIGPADPSDLVKSSQLPARIVGETSFRDLSYPVAAQQQSRREELQARMNPGIPISSDNCIFGASPSNAKVVSHWLVRQPPFTQLHRQIKKSLELFQSMSLPGDGDTYWEHIPELFSFPEVFVNLNGCDMTDVFPMKRAIDFVYQYRKVLESGLVSRKLPHWINLLFGVDVQNMQKCNVFSPFLGEDVWSDPIARSDQESIRNTVAESGQLPQKLFNSPHPHRLVSAAPENAITLKSTALTFQDPICIKLPGLPINSCCIWDLQESTMLLGLIDADGSVHRTKVDLLSRHCSFSRVWASELKNPIAANFSGGILAVDRFSGLCWLIFHDRVVPVRQEFRPVSFVAASNDAVAVGTDFGLFSWWFSDVTVVSKVEFVLEKVECFSISASFGILAFGTSLGVHICDLESQQISFRCDLKGKLPALVSISDGLGFIVVECDDLSLFVFNVNGQLIRESAMEREIVALKCFTNREGLDFLIVCENNGFVRVCELFYLNFSKPLRFDAGRVVMLEYVERSIIVLTEDNQLTVWRMNGI
jgi:hypothetical protein